MKTWVQFQVWVLVIASMLMSATAAWAQPGDFAPQKQAAEKLYKEGSYAKAHEIYNQINASNLPPEEARWVAFRLADTQWRSAAESDNPDTTLLDDARQNLERQVRDLTRPDQHDRVWAEAEESLGDWHWTRRNFHDWNAAWPYYERALDWWAGQSDLGLARARYLNIVWTMTRPPQGYISYYWGWGNTVPLSVLENAASIARTDEDKARAHYLIARALQQQGGDWTLQARVPEEFEQAIQAGKKTPWYDSALFAYAQWMEQNGTAVMDENGNWSWHPDYAKALALYRQLTTEFTNGESQFWEQAKNEINNITAPQINVSVGSIFLPGSEIQYWLSWRNVRRIRLVLYPVNLNDAVHYPGSSEQQAQWLQTIDLKGLKAVRTWRRTVSDTGNYAPSNEMVRLDKKLSPGAYVLEAKAGGKSARELVLVTDSALVLKNSGRQALLYYCNAVSSAPIAGAPVRLWESWWEDRHWHSESFDGMTGTNGVAIISLQPKQNTSVTLFATARGGDSQAYVGGFGGWYGSYGDQNPAGWRIYAFTDRPAYRPKETVQWKFIARRYDGSVYSTPAGATVEYEIFDPRGAKVKSGHAQLNDFGSAWGSLDLTEQMPLGEYRIQFRNDNQDIGGATLFRLEEYKLPEFQVTVETPEENGHKKIFRLGDTVEATIQADYYFGGPVANADVNVVVRQKPYWHFWHEPRPYPWFYDDMDTASPYGRWGGWYGAGQVITNAVLKTDATGKAVVTFDTPANSTQDYEYDIEARVTDASRREITGSGSVKVTRQPYYVYANTDHHLYRPQDKVTVNFKALDANNDPAPAGGEVKVTRDYWYEIWLAPDGHEVKGDELKRLQAKFRTWPPAPSRPDQKNWELKFRGYEHDDILTRHLQTDTNGDAELSFTPERTGYYSVTWTSLDRPTNRPPQAIKAETTVWIANNRTTELGYRTGGVQIIADKDTFHAGQPAPVMLVAPTADQYVLFTVEGQDIYDYQVVHLEGTVKLIHLDVDEKDVPNVFLNATLVSDRQIFTDQKQIIVPPMKNFLNVEVKPDRDNYEPRQEGTLTVTTRDEKGKPVSAEVALALVDESVFYIQDDYAGDPREFFFGTKRNEQVQTQSTMNQKRYVNLVEWKNELINDKDKEQAEKQKDLATRTLQADSGGGGVGSANVTATYSAGTMSFGGEIRPGASAITMDELAQSGRPVGIAGAVPVFGDAPVVGRLFAARTPMGQFPAGGNAAGENSPAVVVRNDFRSTVFWQPDVMTGSSGEATVKVKYPDSLTRWRATARAVTEGNQFGIATATTRTRQPLIIRLEGPRFFVVGDTVMISAVANNNTDEPLAVKAWLEASNLDVVANGPVSLQVPAHGEARADWTAKVDSAGAVNLKVTGRSEHYADAMEKTFPSYEHGIGKFISNSGKTRSDDTTVILPLPHDRKAGSTSLDVQITPSMAVTMLDALPYLINYPYGCTEQTMSRFLPTVVTAKTLRDLGLKPEDIMGRVFGGIETNTAAATHPQGSHNLDEMHKMTQAGLDRLYDYQHGDGGWGWWKDDDSDHWMTAYVVWGLALARDAGVHLKPQVLSRGMDYLNQHLVDEKDNDDMQAFMLHALASCRQGHGEINKFQKAAFDNLWKNRGQLNAYTRALLALSAHAYGFDDDARILAANLENGVIRDDRPDQSVLIGNKGGAPAPTVMGTAHWGNDGIFWHWSDSGVEATAFALRALLAIDPTNALVEPAANWLIKNRRGAQWNNTRDTAIAVLALNDYLRASGELRTEAAFKLFVNGHFVAERKISGADVFNAPSEFHVDPKWIEDTNEIRIVRESGSGPLYFAANARFFSTEDPITPAGNEIFAKREYYKIVPRPTLLKGYVDDRLPLQDGETVTSGERVETVLTIEAKNDYDYLMFEDLKPAGFEAVQIRSGDDLYARELKSGAVQRIFGTNQVSRSYVVQPGDTLSGIAEENQSSVAAIQAENHLESTPIKAGQTLLIPMLPAPGSDSDYTGRICSVYRELRDRQVALFIDHLPQGVWEIRYDYRAETPGYFHALPVVGGAMYVPEIRCNSAEMRIRIEDKQP